MDEERLSAYGLFPPLDPLDTSKETLKHPDCTRGFIDKENGTNSLFIPLRWLECPPKTVDVVLILVFVLGKEFVRETLRP